jgi:hypothetical protein
VRAQLAAAAADGTGPAAAAGGRKSGFTTVQLPANLLETEALREGGAAPWACSHGLTVLFNRPLNAFPEPENGGGAYRLAEYEPEPGYAASLQVTPTVSVHPTASLPTVRFVLPLLPSFLPSFLPSPTDDCAMCRRTRSAC